MLLQAGCNMTMEAETEGNENELDWKHWGTLDKNVIKAVFKEEIKLT